MKIRKLGISNLLSFDDVNIDFENYNVVVGHNASGKTNLIRLLKSLSHSLDKISENKNYRIDLHDWKINDNIRFNKIDSSITITFLLAADEFKLILQWLVKKNLSLDVIGNNRLLRLTIYWKKTINESELPTYIIAELDNSLILWAESSDRDFLSVSKNITMNNNYGSQKYFVNTLLLYIQNKKDYSEIQPSNQESSNSKPIYYSTNDLLKSDEFQSSLETNNYDIFDLDPYKRQIPLEYRNFQFYSKEPLNYIAEIFDCFKIQRTLNSDPLTQISLWNLIGQIIHNSLVYLDDIRLPYEDLANNLDNYSRFDEDQWIIDYIDEGLQILFPEIKFKTLYTNAEQEKKQKPYIQITEENNNKKLDIKNSANGYFEALAIFSSIASNKNNNIIILDEPALHLHPIKIRLLGRHLMKMTDRQIIIITHSPYFIDLKLFSKNNNLISLNKKEANSKIFFKSNNFECEIIPSLFKPEIFFSKFIIIVEGGGDAAVFSAISENTGNILEKNDIFVLDSDGQGNIKNYISLFNEYHLGYLALVDNPCNFAGKNKNIIKLSNKLEHELQKLGYTGSLKKSIDVNTAYNFIDSLMKGNKRKNVINSVFGKIIKKSLTETNSKLPLK